ncbi:MAG: HTTM domain-containing protein [Planctomycetaceae bacterium]
MGNAGTTSDVGHAGAREACRGRLRRWARDVFSLDVRSLAAYRIALGCILCVDCVLRSRDFPLMLGVDGMFPPDAMRRSFGDPTVWSLAFLVDADWWNAAVLALEGVAGVALAAGVATPAATVAAWAAVWSVIRRAGPAASGGDVWLACQLFWAMFMPLGAAWSGDARRRAAGAPPARGMACSIATVALVLQLVTVYVSAGLAKCNASWLSGNAVAHALSVHDHGTALGMALARSGLVGDPAAWAIVALEVAAPLLLLAWPSPRVRAILVAAFLAFHVLIGFTMTVGLFVPIGIAAWLPLVPSRAWDRGRDPVEPRVVCRLRRPAAWACGAALALAAVSLVTFRCGLGPLPRPIVVVLNVCGLHQDWRMFGFVPDEEQWVYARAELVDGRVVDLLRGGRPCGDSRPEGGFTSLADNRWHNICWCLGWPAQAPVAPTVAAGLARHWNATHAPGERVRSLEIRHARQRVGAADEIERERLIASWPPRDAAGGGNLDRLLEATGGGDVP